MDGLELSSLVSTRKNYFVGDPQASMKVAAMDFGIKANILRCLAARGCYIQVFPPKLLSKKWKRGHRMVISCRTVLVTLRDGLCHTNGERYSGNRQASVWHLPGPSIAGTRLRPFNL